MTDLALSLAVLAAVALVLGAIALLRRGDRQRAFLMLLLAAVIGGNVAIWTLPTRDGAPLAAATPR